MYFVISCIDKPGALGLRMETRPAHIEFLKAHADAVKFAGPYLGEDGETMAGSLIILEADDRASAETFATADPYAQAGLFASTDIRAWKWTIGNPDA